MRNKYLITIQLCLALSFLLTSCSPSKETSNVSENSSLEILATSSTKNEIVKKDMNDLLGEWYSAEDNSSLTITKEDSNFTFIFSDSDIGDLVNVSGTQESPVLFRFITSEGHSQYSFGFLSNDELIFYFTPTNPEEIGMSKPLEFKRAN